MINRRQTPQQNQTPKQKSQINQYNSTSNLSNTKNQSSLQQKKQQVSKGLQNQYLNTPQSQQTNNSGYYQDQSVIKSLNPSELMDANYKNAGNSQFSTNPQNLSNLQEKKQQIIENIVKNLVDFNISDLKDIELYVLNKQNNQDTQNNLQESFPSFKFQGGVIGGQNTQNNIQDFDDQEEIPDIIQQTPQKKENKAEKIQPGQMFNTTQDFGQFIKAKDMHIQKFDRQDLIKFKIIQTWGSTSIVGITEIQFFDIYGEKIEVQNDDISLNIDNVNKNITDLHKLNNGITQTQNKNHMWTGVMPEPPYCLEIIYQGIQVNEISEIKIWNYNKSVIESTKGVKEMQIMDYQDKIIWTGQIQRGCGNVTDEYCTIVQLQNIKEKSFMKTKNDSNLTLKSIPKFIDHIPNEDDQQKEDNYNKNKSSFDDQNNQNQQYNIEVHNPSELSNSNTLSDQNQIENVKEIIQHEEKLQNIPDIQYENESTEKYAKVAKYHKRHISESQLSKQEQERKEREIEDELNQINQQLHVFDQQKEYNSKNKSKLKTSNMYNNNNNNIEIQQQQQKTSLQQNKSQKNDLNVSIDNIDNKNQDYEQSQIQNDNQQQNQMLNTLKMFQLNNEGCFQVTDEKQKLGDAVSEMQQLVDNNLQQVQKNLENSNIHAKDLNQQDDDIDQFFIEEIKNSYHKQVQKNTLEQSMKINTQKSFYNSNKNTQELRKRENSNLSRQTSMGTTKSAVIKSLPSGQYLQIKIFSTWGDKYYVGLNGIQFFDQNGDEIQITKPKKQIKADPSDINVLPQYNNDPRIIKNIVNNVYSTRDDLNVWLAPFSKGKTNFIWVDFMKNVQISMIRIWNYNKSRIHSFRGVKDIQISLQNKVIFQGEIQKSPGHLQEGLEKQFESIYFTDNSKIIEHIKAMDWIQNNNNSDQFTDSYNNIMNVSPTKAQNRPLTGHQKEEDEQKLIDDYENLLKNQDDRPFTVVDIKQSLQQEQQQMNLQQSMALKESIILNKTLNFKANQKILKKQSSFKNTLKTWGIKCSSLSFEILSNWGDEYVTGLSRIQVLDQNNKQIINTANQNNKFKLVLNGKHYESILNEIIIQYKSSLQQQNTQKQVNTLTIQFSTEQIITGVRIWNYSKRQREDTLKGIKNVAIYSNNKNYLTDKEGVIIRKAEGNLDIFDPGQLISLPYQQIQQKYFNQQQQSTLVNQFYEVFNNIIGLNIKINILSNWGDLHYVGLNRIDIFDGEGNSITKNGNLSIAGYPSSVNIISGLKNDHRTIDKLLNAKNDDKNVWLTPFISQLELENQQNDNFQKVQSQNNKILMYLDQPQKIGGIKFYNYSKTIQRGVKEIEIIVDDILVYKGYLNQFQSQEEQMQDELQEKQTCVLFTLDLQVKNKICGSENYEEQKFDQHVNFYNENKLEKQKI